jgi:CheY-like chemotaxis protein
MLRVLVVDDEENIRSVLQQVLQKEGFSVTTVGTVTDALALISHLHFDVLISDLNIGHPADGFVVVSAMRRTQPDALTFILTDHEAISGMSYIEVGNEDIKVQMRNQRQCVRYGSDCCDAETLLLKDLLEARF